MIWRQLGRLVLGVGLGTMFLVLAFARPWQPKTEWHITDGYFLHSTRSLTLHWQDWPWLSYSQSSSQHGESTTQSLTLGFLRMEREESVIRAPSATSTKF